MTPSAGLSDGGRYINISDPDAIVILQVTGICYSGLLLSLLVLVLDMMVMRS